MKWFSRFGGLILGVALGCGSSAKAPISSGGAGMGSGGGSGTGGSGTGGSGTGGLPPQVPPRSPPGSCGLDHPAFCEEFDTPHPGGRGGDIDEAIWSFARWGHETRQNFVRVPASTETDRTITSVFCGQPFSNIMLDNDVVSCDGVGVNGLTSRQLNEVYDDYHDFAFNSMRIRQMFDFTDRTGTVMFDVDAKVNPLNLGHGWWVEFWITDDEAPMPYHESPGVVSYPKNGFGINFQGLNSCNQGRNATQISRVFVTKDYTILHDYPGWELKFDNDNDRCITVADQKLNRFKVLVTKDSAEIWASNFDSPTLHRLATVPVLDLSFTRGYVHLQHSQYNARKDGNVTGVQTYRWDNIGFDGPVYANPRSYEVPNNTLPDIDGVNGHMYGYQLTATSWTSLSVTGVDLSGATRATFNFNSNADSGRALLYRFNGGPTHTLTIPQLARVGLRGFSEIVPLAELVAGDNKIEVMMSAPQTNPQEYVGNLEVSIQAAP